jgi:hypothetical protein
MADVKGVYNTNYYTDSPPTLVASGVGDGRLKHITDTYEAASLVTTSDILVGPILEVGAVIKDVTIFNDALGASTTLAVHTRALSDAAETVVMAAQSTSSAAILTPVAGDIANLPSAVAERSELLITQVGGTASGTIKIIVTYSE